MLEQFFVKPSTVDRLRASWIGAEIEAYVVWLVEHGYGARAVWRRVPIVCAFGEHAGAHGAVSVADLPRFVDGFVDARVAAHHRRNCSERAMAKEVRGPVDQMLSTVLPGFVPSGRATRSFPLTGQVPGFVEYLVDERGLRPASVEQYRHHLDRFDVYLQRVGASVADLSPALASAFMVERASVGLARSTVRDAAGVLRVFVRFAYRSGILESDLSAAVGWPQVYRLSNVPVRSRRMTSTGFSPRSIGAPRSGDGITRSCCCWSPMGCVAARSRRSSLITSIGSVAGWQFRNARPVTRLRSRCRRWSAKRSSTTSSMAAPPPRIVTCSSGRAHHEHRSDRQRCRVWRPAICNVPV